MFNVVELLRPVREKRAGGLEELAEKLIAGERIPAEVIEQKLYEAHRDAADLQAIIERRTRVKELVAVIHDAPPAEKRMAVVEGEITKARADFDRARDQLAATEKKHDAELRQLRGVVQQATAAKDALLSRENLPPALWQEFRDAERAADDAEEAYQSAVRRLPDLKTNADFLRRFADRVTDGPAHKLGSQFVSKDVEEAKAVAAEELMNEVKASIPKLKAAWDAAVAEREKTRVSILKELGV